MTPGNRLAFAANVFAESAANWGLEHREMLEKALLVAGVRMINERKGTEAAVAVVDSVMRRFRDEVARHTPHAPGTDRHINHLHRELTPPPP